MRRRLRILRWRALGPYRRWIHVPAPVKWTIFSLTAGTLAIAFIALGITLSPTPLWLKCFAWGTESIPLAPLCFQLAKRSVYSEDI